MLKGRNPSPPSAYFQLGHFSSPTLRMENLCPWLQEGDKEPGQAISDMTRSGAGLPGDT